MTLETAASADGQSTFLLRCADVFPVRCDESWRSPSREELVHSACAHGAGAHGFTPVWFTSERVAAMTDAATR